jgi:dUTP pyrophosphatase
MSRVLVTIYAESAELLPERKREQDTGLDMRAAHGVYLSAHHRARIPTGITLHVMGPPGVKRLDIQARGRSGLAVAGYLLHVGTIDANYRGPMDVLMFNTTDSSYLIKPGDRVAQLVIPEFAFDRFTGNIVPVETELAIGVAPDDSDRGTAGYGSSGRA